MLKPLRCYRCAYAILVAVFFSGLSFAGDAPTVEWFHHKSGVDEALRELRPVFIDFGADWCAPCRAMEQEVYADTQIVELLQHFVAIHVDVDRDPATTSRFFVRALPTLVFLDPFGNEFKRHEGFLPASSLSTTLEAIPKDYSLLAEVREQISPGSKDLAAVLVAADFYKSLGHFDMSTRVLERSLRESEKASPHEIVDEAWIRIGLNHLAVRQEKDAEKVFRKRLKGCRCPKRAYHYLGLAKSLFQRGKAKDARKVYEEMLNQFPDGPLSDLARQSLAELR